MILRFALGATLALLGIIPILSSPVSAQETESVAAFTDWAVFNPADPRECYIVSQPTSWKAERNGQVVNGVQRGEIRLFVTTRPNAGIIKEVGYTGGYPFAPNSTVEVKIGSEVHKMNVGEGDAREWAWATSPEVDAALVAGMRRGANAVLTAVSARGTTTTDTFSLRGFTAALQEATRLCQ